MRIAGEAIVITVSTRAAGGVYADTTGPVIAEWCAQHGFTVRSLVVADGPELAGTLRNAVACQARLLITTGGTGIAPGDGTPDATRPLLDLELPGFGEELRRRGAAHNASALLSRATAGIAGRTLVVNLPGSIGGVRDGLELLSSLVDHAIAQLEGDDHERDLAGTHV